MIIISYSLNSRNKLIEQFMGMDRSTMLNIRVNWNFAVPVLEIVEMACTFNRQDDINPNINQRPDASTARTPSLVVTEPSSQIPAACTNVGLPSTTADFDMDAGRTAAATHCRLCQPHERRVASPTQSSDDTSHWQFG